MTVSGTITYEPTTTEIITGAFNILGVVEEGEGLTARMYEDGLRALNGLIQSASAARHLWSFEEGSVALIADTPSYVVTPRALRITECRYRNTTSLIDVPMTEMSRQEYYDQPNKTTSPSMPVNFYFDPKVASGTLYLWPCPSATTAAAYSIKYTYTRFLDIMDATNETLDFPQQWIEPVTWKLATRLMTQYPVNDAGLANIILGQAKEFWDQLRSWDNEPASIFLQPESRWGG